MNDVKKEILTIKKMGINGEGVGYLQKKVAFVKGALKDEVVEVSVLNSQSTYISCQLEKVKEASKHRVEASCPVAKQCLGCPLLHADESYQYEQKKELIQEAFSKYTNFSFKETKLLDVLSPQEKNHYRHDVRLPIVFYQGRVSIGIFQRESKFFTYMSSCQMQEDIVNLILKRLEETMNRLKTKVYDDRSKLGVRFLILRHLEGKIQLLFVTGKNGLDEPLIEEIKKWSSVASLYYTINTSRYQDFDMVGYRKVFGSSRLTFSYGHYSYQVSLKSDLPVHLPMHFKMLKEVLHLLPDHLHHVLSIRPGIGLLESLLDESIHVTMIESKGSNSEDASLNLKSKPNIRIMKGSEEEMIVKEAKKKEADLFILQHMDSMSETLKDSIRRSKVKHLLWIGDHYSMMAKDLGELSALYQLETLLPYDGEPNSAKVYLVAKLRRRS